MVSPAPTMQALVFDGPAADTRGTRVTDLPVPEPGPGQVSIDVEFAGVNFKDVMSRRGDAGYVRGWPHVPGLEVSGRVRAVGVGVTGVTPGTRVAAYTGHGGLAAVSVAEAETTVGVPDGLELRAAGAAPGALTTAVLLLGRIGRLTRAETVLVHGAAGGVGQALAQLARLTGAGQVIGTVGSPVRVAAAERSGYDVALVRGNDLVAAVGRRTGGRGVDLVLDPQGTGLLEQDLQMAAAGGRIVLFGNATGEALDPLPATGRLFAGNVSIGGFSLAALAATAPAMLAEALRQVLDHMMAGRLDIEVTTVHGLAAAADAQQALAEGRGPGKQVVQIHAPCSPAAPVDEPCGGHTGR